MRFRSIIVNSSPIISLANIGYANLLTDITDSLLIPNGVREEILYEKYSDTAASWTRKLPEKNFYKIEVNDDILAWSLGKGESQVITLSIVKNNMPVIIDDRVARRCANVYNIKVAGTISIIIKSKQAGLINSASLLLNKLHDEGFRVSQTILTEALKLSGEYKY